MEIPLYHFAIHFPQSPLDSWSHNSQFGRQSWLVCEAVNTDLM